MTPVGAQTQEVTVFRSPVVWEELKQLVEDGLNANQEGEHRTDGCCELRGPPGSVRVVLIRH